jgi:hypothetical protein
MSEPSIQDLARANEASYTGGGVPDGYTREPFSTSDISVFKNNNNGHYIVSHRGTDVNAPTAGRDLKADFKILTGQANGDRLTKRRSKATEDAYRKIRETAPDAPIYLSGHSLGGFSASRALSYNPYVRENTKRLDTFNAGASPFQNKPISKTNKYYYDIKDKSVHHRIADDDISANLKSSMVGTFKTYKTNQKPTIAQSFLKYARPFLDTTPAGKLAFFGAERLGNTLQSHSLQNFIKPNKSIK